MLALHKRMHRFKQEVVMVEEAAVAHTTGTLFY